MINTKSNMFFIKKKKERKQKERTEKGRTRKQPNKCFKLQ